jgi:CRP-like cAMP-binding protein
MGLEKMLKGTELFGSLNVDEVHRVSTFSSMKEFKAGETVFTFNKSASHFYVLMEGTIYLQLPANPPEFNFAISKIEKGHLFGLSPLLDVPRYTSTAYCYEDVKVLCVEAKPFRELLRHNYTAGFPIINQVARVYFNRYMEVLKRLNDVVSQISLIH